MKNEASNNTKISETTYNFDVLCRDYPALDEFVIENNIHNKTIDFSNPKAVKALNKAILLSDYKINYWDFPDENLCPPIPGRAAYIKILNDLLIGSLNINIHILDIGTGATCIYPLLGNALFKWQFTGTDIDSNSVQSAQKIIDSNNLNKQILLRSQSSSYNVFKNVIEETDKFTATMCNPPFYESQEAADKETLRKNKGLGQSKENISRNFGGKSNELWVEGGEISFIKKYIKESYLFKNQCFWFTILVSKKENIRKTKVALKKLNATEIKTITMDHGNKQSRIMAWTFLKPHEQEKWN